MTLTILHDLEQGTAEWHDARRGIVTASTVGKLLTPTLKVANNDTARAVTATLVAERITGYTEPTFANDDMIRGQLSEPIARDLYSGHFEQVDEVGFLRLDEDGWTLGASPDGLVGEDGGLEVKSPRAKGHILTILRDEVPAIYMPQVQACLLVSGRRWWDYCSYHAGLPLYVKRVYPDPAWFEAIEAACIAFEEKAAEMVADFERRSAGMPQTERLDLELVI
ncbi:hypothetical protein NOK12_16900 [Nocardioides sp. OK12]|uniref:lambda exonuclease family protein n=1 Tax=Nocardioides sp. OK12 TaxID=2758661 RepID=UPI0021C2840B|nr:lambda exonuclease family protein [Nocardioides sp. OK12]GHJ59172.1 hypothetical protein NOK12_16900 [Nocardioides sp. OK12]